MKTGLGLLTLLIVAGGTGRCLGLDLGPVHIHGTDVKVGNEVNFDITVEKVAKAALKEGQEGKPQVQEIQGHRKDDEGDKFKISVPSEELDKESKELLTSLQEVS